MRILLSERARAPLGAPDERPRCSITDLSKGSLLRKGFFIERTVDHVRRVDYGGLVVRRSGRE